jgi:hypothetical protein
MRNSERIFARAGRSQRRASRSGARAAGTARRACVLLLLCLAGLTSARTAPDAHQPEARVTQIDTDSFPHLRIHLSITDASGNPITDDQPVTLYLYDGEDLVYQEELSPGGGPPASRGEQPDGRKVFSVLVLDMSKSMGSEGKLDQARAAANQYIDTAPPDQEIALVTFASQVKVFCAPAVGKMLPHAVAPEDGRCPSDRAFTTDKARLHAEVNSLDRAAGRTALQEAIGAALDLLRGRTGRRDVLALTDGYENQSGGLYRERKGQDYLIQRANSEEDTISAVGLGNSVKEADLKRYEETGGTYSNSTVEQLPETYVRKAKLLAKERVVEYDTNAKTANGTRGRIHTNLVVGKQSHPGPEREYVRPGLLPHVRGNHSPFFVAVAVLFVLPGLISLFTSFYVVWRFRALHVKRLKPGSVHLSRRDLNYDQSHGTYKVGDLVIVCPASGTPYYVRSWRMCRCKCGRDGDICAGRVCYHQVLPQWARAALDWLSNGHEGREGRTWLCRCAGDKSGY